MKINKHLELRKVYSNQKMRCIFCGESMLKGTLVLRINGHNLFYHVYMHYSCIEKLSKEAKKKMKEMVFNQL